MFRPTLRSLIQTKEILPLDKNDASRRSRRPIREEARAPQGTVKTTNVIFISFICVLFGFVLGVWVMNYLGTRENPVVRDSERQIPLLKSMLQKNPNDLQALIEQGNIYFDTHRYQEAIDAYSKALAIDPRNPDVRTDLGIMYRELKRFDEALNAFRRAAQDDPAHLNSRFNIGIVLKYDKGDFPGAIQAWEEFLKVASPEDERVAMVLKEIETMKKSLPKK
jgi:cytochrome c-type biogenesis protein CcmH/NrfG